MLNPRSSHLSLYSPSRPHMSKRMEARSRLTACPLDRTGKPHYRRAVLHVLYNITTLAGFLLLVAVLRVQDPRDGKVPSEHLAEAGGHTRRDGFRPQGPSADLDPCRLRGRGHGGGPHRCRPEGEAPPGQHRPFHRHGDGPGHGAQVDPPGHGIHVFSPRPPPCREKSNRPDRPRYRRPHGNGALAQFPPALHEAPHPRRHGERPDFTPVVPALLRGRPSSGKRSWNRSSKSGSSPRWTGSASWPSALPRRK